MTNTSTTPIAEFIKPAEDLSHPQGQLGDSKINETAATEAVPATEIIKDAVSRKRRSRSPPPPDTETSAKRARPSEQADEEVSFKPEVSSESALQTDAGNDAATRDTTHHHYEEQYARQETTPPHFQERQVDNMDEPMDDYDRAVAPAQHPATAALYIKNFMRPLREPVLRDYLIELAAFPGASPNPDCLVNFYLDQIRSHAYVQFTSISAASRVRSALHGTIWPNERNRKELWVDFIPEDKVVEWTERELAEGGRGSSARWEVQYEPDDNGIMTATLINAETAPQLRRNSGHQPLGAPPVPTGPSARNYPGVEGAPLGPRGRGTNHYRQQQAAFPPQSTFPDFRDRDRDRDRNRDRTYPVGGRSDRRTTRAHPPLVWKPVSEEVAQRRLDNMKAHITKDRRRDLGRPDEINRYTFEQGDEFVDRGQEAFIGIRPPHRERERRRLGIGRGRGSGGGGGGRRRSASPPPLASPLRGGRMDDGGGYRGDGYHGGGGRDEYRDRRDGWERDRGYDDIPRSRFNGQPLPTYNGPRGSRRGGGRRDRY
ncbi:hypothetical protein VTI74DRAFT_4 [Chaetomium olivicolor]